MTVAIVAVSVVAIVLACVLVAITRAHSQERDEWRTERRQLVDRAIARHAGEVIAFDRSEKPRPKQTAEPQLVEGLT